MFISVDLPAPFSPRSACTSPSSRSRSMWSFATMPGKRLVMPRSSRTGGWATDSKNSGAGRRRPAPRIRAALLDRLRDALDETLLQQLVLRRDRVADRRRHLRAPLAVADAVRLRVEDRVVAAAERRARLRARADRLVDGHVHLLLRARQDVRAEVALVGVDADAHDVLLLRGIEGAEPATARDLEDHARAVRDLVQRQLLALRLVDEVLRVAVDRGRAGVRLLDPEAVAGDVA